MINFEKLFDVASQYLAAKKAWDELDTEEAIEFKKARKEYKSVFCSYFYNLNEDSKKINSDSKLTISELNKKFKKNDSKFNDLFKEIKSIVEEKILDKKCLGKIDEWEKKIKSNAKVFQEEEFVLNEMTSQQSDITAAAKKFEEKLSKIEDNDQYIAFKDAKKLFKKAINECGKNSRDELENGFKEKFSNSPAGSTELIRKMDYCFAKSEIKN
jgi:hypothetical protein